MSFEVDGAKNMKLLCVSQSNGQDDSVLGKTTVKVQKHNFNFSVCLFTTKTQRSDAPT